MKKFIFQKKRLNSSQRKICLDFFRKYTLTDEERKEVWKARIGNKLKITKELYHGLFSRLHSRSFPKKVDKLIRDDLDRTFPNCLTFEEGKRMYSKMHNLLRLFQLYRPDIGYIQGMTYIISTLYYYFDEYETFKCFCNLVITNNFMRNMYTFNMKYVKNLSIYIF